MQHTHRCCTASCVYSQQQSSRSCFRFVRIAATQPCISGEWRLAAVLVCTGSVRLLAQPLKQLQPSAEQSPQSVTVMSCAADASAWSPSPQLDDQALQLQMGGGGGGAGAGGGGGGGGGEGAGGAVAECSCTATFQDSSRYTHVSQASDAAATMQPSSCVVMDTLRVVVIARTSWASQAAGPLQRVCDGMMHALQPRTRMLVEVIPLFLPNAVIDARTFVRQVRCIPETIIHIPQTTNHKALTTNHKP